MSTYFFIRKRVHDKLIKIIYGKVIYESCFKVKDGEVIDLILNYEKILNKFCIDLNINNYLPLFNFNELIQKKLDKLLILLISILLFFDNPDRLGDIK